MGQCSKGEDYLIKNNMLGDDDIVGGEIETPITFVISGVSEEDRASGPGGFMGRLCREVRIANTAEHAQVLI
jgi:hypothetical protein